MVQTNMANYKIMGLTLLTLNHICLIKHKNYSFVQPSLAMPNLLTYPMRNFLQDLHDHTLEMTNLATQLKTGDECYVNLGFRSSRFFRVLYQ